MGAPSTPPSMGRWAAEVEEATARLLRNYGEAITRRAQDRKVLHATNGEDRRSITLSRNGGVKTVRRQAMMQPQPRPDVPLAS